jgi:hypothetical protein
MKVLDLACAQAHVFEGWFASEEDFRSQLARDLIECPVCGEKRVEKRLSAPRLNLGHSNAPQEDTTELSKQGKDTQPGLSAEMQAAMLQALRELVARTEDVGDRFAAEARRMHHGDAEKRNIRGSASPEEARDLLGEGIGVIPLPDLPFLKESLQ